MRERLRLAAWSSPMIASVFRVCYIGKRFRLRGEIGLTLLLASRTKRYVALADQSGSHVSVGDLICVKGCILQRGGRPVLVARSLDRVARSGSSVRRRLVAVDLEGPRGGEPR